MPFTPLHLGPGVLLGLPLRNLLHVPTLLLASVILDLEPLFVFVFGLNYPLHGYFHTFLIAIPTGSVLGYLMHSIDPHLKELYRSLKLVDRDLGLKSFILSGILGASMHVAFDSPLYSDIRPFWPLASNPMYEPSQFIPISDFCIASAALGLIYYIFLSISGALK